MESGVNGSSAFFSKKKLSTSIRIMVIILNLNADDTEFLWLIVVYHCN